MLHELITSWFHWIEYWGYPGVFLLMAMESSIFPVPSEVVMPLAAFWAAQGRMNFWGVVLAGTVGSYAGSSVSYFAARWIGLPLLLRYGRYVLLPPEKLAAAEVWVLRFGVAGIFVARFLPIVRHVVSMPAGVFKMPFGKFSAATLFGAGLWCTALSWFGREVLGDHPELLNSPEDMARVVHSQMGWFIFAFVVMAVLYATVLRFKTRSARHLEPLPEQEQMDTPNTTPLGSFFHARPDQLVVGSASAMPTRKQALLAELIQRLSEALEVAQRSHRAAVEGATHEQAKPENDKDTRGLEQSYLARGQALRIADQTAQLAILKAMSLRPLSNDAAGDVGTLVTLEEDDKLQRYLILPHGGGLVLDDGAVQVVTPSAPICRAMIGKHVGDETVLTLGGKKRELVVDAIE